jgi:hypothetical protein
MRARGIALPILDSGARGGGGGWSATRAGRFIHPEKKAGAHCTGAWMGLGASLDGSGKSHHTGVRTPDSTARSECVETGLRIFALKF